MPRGRCHNLRTGLPKIRYLDLDSAQEAAGEVNLKNRERGWVRKPVGPYPCQVHGCWHVGRPPDPGSTTPPTVRLEVGERAWGNLTRENRGTGVQRYRVLVRRAVAAALRRERGECRCAVRTTGTAGSRTSTTTVETR